MNEANSELQCSAGSGDRLVGRIGPLEAYGLDGASVLGSDSSGFNLQQGTWYMVEFDWMGTGEHKARLYDLRGTQLASTSGTDREWTTGGIGFDVYADDEAGETVLFDLVTLRRTALPNDVTLTNPSSSSVDFEFSVTGLAHSATTESTASTISGTLPSGASREYAFSGDISYLEDNVCRLEFDRANGDVTVRDLTGDLPEYEVTVSGTLSASDSNNDATINGGTASGSVAGSEDIFDFTGDLDVFKHVSTLTADVRTAFTRVLDSENPYPNAAVQEIVSRSVKDPDNDRIAFSTTAIDSERGLYLARGVSDTSQVPTEIQRLSEGSPIAITDLQWSSSDGLQYWQDGLTRSRIMSTSNAFERPRGTEISATPDTSGGGA